MKNTMADANVNAMLNSQNTCIETVDDVAQRIRHAQASTPT